MSRNRCKLVLNRRRLEECWCQPNPEWLQTEALLFGPGSALAREGHSAGIANPAVLKFRGATSTPPSHRAQFPPKRFFKMATTDQATLSATYSSNTNAPFTVGLPLTAPRDSATVASKTKYLSELRQSVISMQGQINRELTARMEEDKARDASAAAATGAKVVDDEKEEENYGEEVPEDEEAI